MLFQRLALSVLLLYRARRWLLQPRLTGDSELSVVKSEETYEEMTVPLYLETSLSFLGERERVPELEYGRDRAHQATVSDSITLRPRHCPRGTMERLWNLFR
ncbi:hypothetical protein OE88DRAFT_1082517 [Heliocybe sulcata]|uniref:Uncharacterized protein n=1 Tax=Heliocybe sulcata TaxID=5364 RepID=A0A5C3MK64_9AGAM|nr:hypothetical protein OE88DRAFT_1082517 [Heliocybe sulcata]